MPHGIKCLVKVVSFSIMMLTRHAVIARTVHLNPMTPVYCSRQVAWRLNGSPSSPLLRQERVNIGPLQQSGAVLRDAYRMMTYGAPKTIIDKPAAFRSELNNNRILLPKKAPVQAHTLLKISALTLRGLHVKPGVSGRFRKIGIRIAPPTKPRPPI